MRLSTCQTPLIALLAFAGVVATSSSAQAAAFANGDIILAIQDVGTGSFTNPNVYLLDLTTAGGLSPVGTFPTSTTTLVSNLSSELTSAFPTVSSTNWYTNPNLLWGVFGYTGGGGVPATYHPFASETEPSLGSPAAGFTGLSQSTLNTAGSQMKNVYGEAGTYVSTTSQASTAVIAQNTDSNGYAKENPTAQASSFGAFNNASLGIQGSEISGSALDLFSQSAANVSNYEGTIKIDSSGDVIFSPTVGAAPEPGRVMLLGLGMAGLLLRRRRPSTSIQ